MEVVKASKKFKMGFATSSLQEDPFSACFRIVEENNVQIAKPISNWSTWLMNGINSELNKAWIKAEKKNNPKIIKALLEKEFQEVLNQFIHEGVDITLKNNPKNGYKLNYIQLDLKLIREALSGLQAGVERSRVFFETLREVINKSIENNLGVKIFINQFNDEEIRANYNEEYLDELQSELARLVCDENSRKHVELRYFKQRSVEDWKSFVDDVITVGEVAYGEIKMLRVSIEWAEVLPEKDFFDEKAALKFAEIIKYIKSQGLEVTVCLNHMSNPLWLKKGWATRSVVKHHQRFVEALFDFFEEQDVVNKIDRVLVFNEPHTWLPQGYLDGRWPPYSGENWILGKEITAIGLSTKAIRNFIFRTKLYKTFYNNFYNAWMKSIKAHVRTYRYLKSKYDFKISTSEIYTGYKPEDRKVLTKIAISVLEKTVFAWFEIMKEMYGHENTYDFIAPQLYATLTLSSKDYGGLKLQRVLDNPKVKNKHVNGWTDDPAIFVIRTIQLCNRELKNAISDERLYLSQLRKISFTEFGTPAGAISARAKFESILANLNKVRKMIPLEFEYMLNWAPFDNWEWDSGYGNWARFGDLNIDGTPKPEIPHYVNYINWKDSRILKVSNELLKTMTEYRRLSPSLKDREILDKRINRLLRFLKDEKVSAT
jgi:beta-glucosidase/6-phospho-beta-glucosidase/beta-galactosidase